MSIYVGNTKVAGSAGYKGDTGTNGANVIVKSTTNGDINVDGTDIVVYDDTNVKSSINSVSINLSNNYYNKTDSDSKYLGKNDNATTSTSADKLTTARKINNVAFDGQSDITITDSTKEPSISAGTTSQYYRGDKTWQTLDKSSVGLSNVDNTSDVNKPISTAQQSALDTKVDKVAGKSLVADTTISALTGGTDTTLHYHASDRNRANHTGVQTSSTISDFASTVLSTVLTGLSTATNAVISATDTVLSALGKLQKQISDHLADTISHITSTERTNWNSASTNSHTHTNKTVLDNTTASYSTAEQTKLSGIATGATNTTSSTTNGNVKINNTETTIYTHPTKHAPSIITQDSSNRFVTDTQISSWNNKIDSTQKGYANGVAQLDSNGLVPSSQLPSYVDDVLEFNSYAEFPATGEKGKIYVDIGTDEYANRQFRWTGSTYVEISKSLALGEVVNTAYSGDKGKATTDSLNTHKADTTNHITSSERTSWNNKFDKTGGTTTGNIEVDTSSNPQLRAKNTTNNNTVLMQPSSASGEYIFGGNTDGGTGISTYIRIGQGKLQYFYSGTEYSIYNTGNKPTKSDVGLSNIDNTSDTDKPLSIAQKNYVDSSIKTISFNARNLLTGTKSFTGFNLLYDAVIDTSNNYNVLTSIKCPSANSRPVQYFTFELGKTYTQSCWMKGSGTYNIITSYGSFNITLSTWSRVSLTFTIDGSINVAGTKPVQFNSLNFSSANPVWQCGMTLNEGNKDIGWIPAPEDVDNAINILKQSGTTRPTPTYIGQVFFDTTLNKPIWCKNLTPTWVDATGTVV